MTLYLALGAWARMAEESGWEPDYRRPGPGCAVRNTCRRLCGLGKMIVRGLINSEAHAAGERSQGSAASDDLASRIGPAVIRASHACPRLLAPHFPVGHLRHESAALLGDPVFRRPNGDCRLLLRPLRLRFFVSEGVPTGVR